MLNPGDKSCRLILNGKKAGQEDIRSAIYALREQGFSIEVRVTWEAGDVDRLVNDACRDEVGRLIAGGGDGTLNEVVDALIKQPQNRRPEIAILPLGTANDFATACQIPAEPYDALLLACTGETTPVDAVSANDRHFINVATGGFGAKVTAETPVELKNFLGGGAYTLTGLVQALNFTPYPTRIVTQDEVIEGDVVVCAVCNNRRAGGGQELAPKALINDGLLDVAVLFNTPATDIPTLLMELSNPAKENQYVKYFQTPWIETFSEHVAPVNLDGEPYHCKHIRFEVVSGAVLLVLPRDSLVIDYERV